MNQNQLSIALCHLFPNGDVIVYEDGRFEVPGKKPTKNQLEAAYMTAVKAQALSSVYDSHAEALRELTGSASPEERDTWPSKQMWAKAYVAGDTSVEPLLLGMMRAQERKGVTVAVAAKTMAEKILRKAEAFNQLIITAEHLKRESKAVIETASTPEDLEAIMVALGKKQAAAIVQFKEKAGV